MNVGALYNEFDPFAAQWLRNLAGAGLIAPGAVLERSIRYLLPADLDGFRQVHLFAGIAGWSRAFRLAGWPDSEPVWSASCPCPPWSRARIWHRDTEGMLDERDLWPIVVPLIEHHRPARIFGEQVSGKKVQPWIGRLRADLARLGYTLYEETRKASSYGGAQGRERFFFAAYLIGQGGQGLVESGSACASRPWRWRGQEDLRAIAVAPFEPGDRWPQPLVRRGDDGLPARVASLRAYGNAIDPYVAADFIKAADEAMTRDRGIHPDCIQVGDKQ